MKRRRIRSGRNGEQGFVILLVAGGLLIVIGAIAMLAIDAVTFYTARSEAQLAADGAALAGARVMANSGATSNPPALEAFARTIAVTTALQVAAQNKVGGRYLSAAVNCSQEVCVDPTLGRPSNPRVKVQITRTDLPTYFARIWGRTQVVVTASATAEAYNPSGASMSINPGGPIAPICVKPWLLPNLDPTKDPASAGPIFDANSGTIVDPSLVGQSFPSLGPNPNTNGLIAKCSSCVGSLTPAVPGQYYPAKIDALDPLAFPPPQRSLPTCSAGFTSYQLAVSGCVQTPIHCGLNANVNIDTNTYIFHTTDRDADTVEAGRCLIHDKGTIGDSDSIDPLAIPTFQYVAGNANPVAGAVGKNVLVSDSLVTVPVFDNSAGVNQPVQVIGFVQLFLNPQGTPLTGTQIPATIINMAGCGTLATGQPVLGTGASAIPVRLVASSP